VFKRERRGLVVVVVVVVVDVCRIYYVICHIFAKIRHPYVRWPIVALNSLHSRNLPSVFSVIIFFRVLCTECLILSCHYCTLCFPLDASIFNHQWDCSSSSDFSSKLHGNFPCILFASHFSFIYWAIMFCLFCLILKFFFNS